MARSQLGIAVAVQILVMSVWFAAAAAVPSLKADWGISSGAAGWLTTAVQIGFVFGALGAGLLNLADRIPVGPLVFGAGALAALSTAAVPLLAGGLVPALPLRFLTGVALAGVYPVVVRQVVSWFGSSRALAMGALLGALTLGSGLPHLVGAFGDLPWRTVLLVTASMAGLGALAALRLRLGPFKAPAAHFHPGYLAQMFRDRRQRDVNFGYFGHMWELYAFWAWIPAFLAAARPATSEAELALAAFVVIGVAGGIGCLLAGVAARRRSAIAAARLALLTSAACCAISPLAYAAPLVLLGAVAIVWGAAVIADSPMFSAALSVAADRRYVGTALTLQMAIGFSITAIAIRVLPLIADAVGWRWTFLALLPGPALALVALRGGADAGVAAGPEDVLEPGVDARNHPIEKHVAESHRD
jgi:MFS family permease